VNLKIERESFLEALQAVSKIILKKNVIAIYDHIVIDVKKDGISLTAANDCTEITTVLPSTNKEEFKICVPSDIIVSTIRYMREQEVKLSYKEETTGKTVSRVLQVISGKSKYKIACEDPTIFPVINLTSTTDKEAVFDAGEFKTAMNTITSFVPDKSDLPAFTGIHIKHIGEGQMLIEGGDRTSIARAMFKARSLNGFSKLIVPKNAIPYEVFDKSEKLNVYQHDNAIKIVSDHFTIIALLIKETYPDTERIFVSEPKETVLLNSVQMIDCVNRLKAYIGEVGCIQMVLGENINMTAVDEGRNNHGEETIEAVCPVKLSTAFNPIELLSIFSKSDADQCVMANSAPKTPYFFTPESGSSTVKYKFLLAPMSI
jgi:DNA polymerase III sliding clamp (beta) subunit (PCNA family)